MQLSKPQHFGRTLCIFWTLLIFPVGGDTKLCPCMHVIGSNLDFNCFASGSNNSGMQRLVEIELRHCYVILESSWNWTPSGVNRTKNCVTVANIIYQDANTNQVINFIEFSTTNNHLLIHREKMFLSSCNSCFNLIS